jgi:adenosylhomocysteine nucleosidase
VSAVAVITGMQSEAECLDKLTRHLPVELRPYIHCAGPGPDRASLACAAVDTQNVSGVVSFGVAGGLDVALLSGTLLMPAAVITSDNAMVETDTQWRQEVSAALLAKPPATLQMGVDHPVTNPKDKERLFREYGTHAVDMESHVIAHYAKDRGLPCIVLRAVADTANDTIPEAALAGLDETGNVVPFRVIRRLAPNPSQLPALLQLARASKAAMKSLRTIPKPAIDALCRIGAISGTH